MLRKIDSNDLNIIYDLGNKYNKNFASTYCLEQYLNNPLYEMKCYEENGIICGFVIANVIYENVEILLIFVDELYRNRGIASSLLRDLEKNNVDSILLEVSVENNAALNLYKKFGYIIVGTRKKYYNGVDAYVMKKVLK